MGVHLCGGGKGGGGVPEDGGIHSEMIEHGRTTYRYAITGRPVLGVGKGVGGAFGYAVVVEGGYQSGGGKGRGGSGSGRGKGWGRTVTAVT